MRLLALIVLSLCVVLAGCPADPAPRQWDGRGRVIDVATGKGIPGAFVIGRYVGTRGAHGASSCNRVEAARADAEGNFEIPIDDNHGAPLLEAYAPRYEFSYSPRTAENGVSGNVDLWQVVAHERAKGAEYGKVRSIEPAVFKTEWEAREVSREGRDAFLRPVNDDSNARVRELDRVQGNANCSGSHSPAKVVAFLLAIRAEMLAVAAPKVVLDSNQQIVGFLDPEAAAKLNK